jgi:hypothetical protein
MLSCSSFSSDNYFILRSKASSLTRKRVCSSQCSHSLVRPLTPNHTLPPHLRLCSLFCRLLRLAGTTVLEFELEFVWRPTVSRPVSLVIGPTFGALDQILSCQSNHTWAEVPQNSRPYLTVSFETPPTWRASFPYLYPPGTGWPSYTPGHWVPFMSPLTTRRDYGGNILTRLHTGYWSWRWSWSSSCGRQSVDQCRLGIGPPFGNRDQIFILFFLLRLTITFFFFRRRLLWRENGSVVYSALTH